MRFMKWLVVGAIAGHAASTGGVSELNEFTVPWRAPTAMPTTPGAN